MVNDIRTLLLKIWEKPVFATLAEHVYVHVAAHEGQLRAVVREICVRNFGPLMKREEFRAALDEAPELCREILEQMAEEGWSWAPPSAATALKGNNEGGVTGSFGGMTQQQQQPQAQFWIPGQQEQHSCFRVV